MRSAAASAGRTLLRPAIAGAAALLFLLSCATIQPGQDPLVVRTEQFLKISYPIYDQTMSWAQRNASTMSPGALKLVNEIRVAFPPLYRSVDAALQVYKANGTGDVLGQISALERLITQMATLVSALGGPDLLSKENP